MNVLVIGYFGYVSNQLDGQTIKTRNIYELLERNCSSDMKVSCFDTQNFKKSKLYFFNLFFKLLKSDIIFDIGAQGNLKYLFPILFIFSFFKRSKLNVIPVGGWLHSFLKNKPFHKFLLSKVKFLYVETDNLYRNLSHEGFKNLYILNNFRNLNFELVYKNNKNLLNFVFLARVHPLKGIDTLFKLDKKLRDLNIKNVNIDVYGPVLDSYKNEFFHNIEKSNISYKGVVSPEDIYTTLYQYDLMLFPTKFYTEGFPGSILDSYISGVPVIVTRWLNSSQFVEDGFTGYIVDFDSDEMFIDKILFLIKKPEILDKLKVNVIKKRYLYTSEQAWKILSLSLK